MKKTILAVSVVLALALAASAQGKKPAAAVYYSSSAGPASFVNGNTAPFAAPALCSPCFFYGGDLNPISINADGFSDENTLLIIGGSATYGAVILPFQAALQGVMFNVLASAAFDPKVAGYDVREGVSDGNGGVSVEHGTANIEIQATGRTAFGFTEYAIAVHFPIVTLEPGVEYWFNVEPQCLNGAQDGSCFTGRFFVSNSEGANNIHGPFQPPASIFLNSNFLGASFVNFCDPSEFLTPGECNLMSFGLMGTPN